MSKFRVWYEDTVGLSKLELSKDSVEEVKQHFNTYYRKFKLVNIVQID